MAAAIVELPRKVEPPRLVPAVRNQGCDRDLMSADWGEAAIVAAMR
jgi:hypothetical protein